MKRTSFRIMVAVALLLIATLNSAVATTYKLVKVTSVEAGKMYVFEQDGRVMNNTTSDDGIFTTDSYRTTGLNGGETYIWTLESSGTYYKLKNLYKTDKQYVVNSENNTKLSFSNTGSIWGFSFQEDGSAIIQNKTSNSVNFDRYLAYIYIEGQNRIIYSYRAYAISGLSTDKYHSINVYQLIEETSEDVTLTTAGMATYVSTHDLDYSNVEGLKAYRAKFDGYEITFTSVKQVPANQGVLLKAAEELTTNTNYTVPFATETVTEWADDYNDFITGTGANVPSEDGGHYNYILNNVGGVVGFYKANNKKVASNRAYLSTTTPPTTHAIGLAFEDETMCIENIAPALYKDRGDVYDLQGRKVAHPTKGLYIVAGHKIIVK